MWVLLCIIGAYGLLQLLYLLMIEGLRRWDARFVPPSAGYEIAPRGAPNGWAAVLLHGYGDSPEAWRRQAVWLAAHGWQVEVPLLSHEADAQIWCQAAVTALKRAQSRAQHVCLWGHSMGGAVALTAAAEVSPDAMVLWAPFFEPALGWRLTRLLYGVHRLLFLWPRVLTFFPAHRRAKGEPSFDYRFQRTLPVRTFRAMLQMPRLAAEARVTCPVTVLLPHRDTVVRTAATRCALPGATFLMATDPRSTHALTNAIDWRENLLATLPFSHLP